MKNPLILVADPDSRIQSMLHELLAGAGFATRSAARSDQALQIILKDKPDLLLTETELHGSSSGLDLIQRARTFSNIPIIVLSSNQDTTLILRCYELGADESIEKPFNAPLLVARVQALLRRCQETPVITNELTCGPLTINLSARQAALEGIPVYLTETEFDLLLELARHSDRVLTHEHLLVAIWGETFRSEINYLRSFIHILRRKLEPDPANPRLILSRPGIGYMLITQAGKTTGR